MAHGLLETSPGEVGVERPVILRRLRRVALDFARAAVAPGVRIDRRHLDTLGRRQGEDDRRAAAEAPDLDDARRGSELLGASVQPPGLLVGQPSLDAVDRTQRVVERT